MEQDVYRQVSSVVQELCNRGNIGTGKILVVGCSTSEILGKHIGKASSEETAAQVWKALHDMQQKFDFFLAIQCCEHLNRALVVERDIQQRFQLTEVAAVPHITAGGALGAHVFAQMTDPVLVEHICADGGVDIGDTFIGMHIRHVAIPLRTEIKSVGQAHVTVAASRPKLIGGPRAHYAPVLSKKTA
jgi:uncharacterized protein (TIGR01440 family)